MKTPLLLGYAVLAAGLLAISSPAALAGGSESGDGDEFGPATESTVADGDEQSMNGNTFESLIAPDGEDGGAPGSEPGDLDADES